MPEYLVPGVYVEEIPSGARTIEGVSTTTAGFIGETLLGPVRPTLVTGWGEFVRRYGGFIDGSAGAATSGYLPYAVRGFFENGGARLVIARVAGSTALTAGVSLTAAGGSLELRALGPGSQGNEIRVTVRPSSTDPALFSMDVEHAGLFETFEHLSTDPARPEFAIAVVNAASEIVEITACPDGAPAPITGAALTGGTDVLVALDDYVAAAHALARLSGISIMAAPDDVSCAGLAAAIIEVCESRQDRFAVTAVAEPSRPAALIRPIRETSWGATYHPWLRVDASHLPAGTAVVPPHGHVCGIYARVDTSRGVHRPPASEEVKGILGLSHTVTQADQEVLNPRGVNVIRDFRPQRGILVWGARTMMPAAEWKYVNVRRLFIFIERSIERGLQWVAFEPNAERTWLDVRRAVEEFLMRLWRDGALAGSRPDHAFYARCDRTTMTDADIEQGRLVCEIGAAPSRPAEFVILRIRINTTADGRD